MPRGPQSTDSVKEPEVPLGTTRTIPQSPMARETALSPTATIAKATSPTSMSPTPTPATGKRSTAISPTLLNLARMSPEEMLQIATSSPPGAMSPSARGRGSRVASPRFLSPIPSPAMSPAMSSPQDVTKDHTRHGTSAMVEEVEPAIPEAYVVISAAAAIFVIFLLYIAIFLKLLLPENGSTPKPSSFCCPLDAKFIAEYLNFSIAPCDNFRNFVCHKYDKNVTEYNPKESIRNDILQGISIKGSPEAALLSRLQKTCVATFSNRKKLVYQFAAAILTYTPDPLFDFIMVLNLGYNLTTGVGMSQRRSQNTTGVELIISKDIQSISQLNILCSSCVGEIVRAFNDVYLKKKPETANVTVDVLMSIDEIAADTKKSRNRNKTQTGNLTLICSILHNIDCSVWHRTFAGFGINTEHINATIFGGEDVNALIAEIDDFWGFRSVDARAYLVAQTTISALHRINLMRNVSSNREIIPNCVRIVNAMANIWDAVYMQLFTNQEKDRQVRQVYSMIVESLKTELASGKIFDAQDQAKAQLKVDNLSLLVPSDMALSSMHVRAKADNFGDNYFASLLQELLSRNTRAASNIPEILSSDVENVILFDNQYMIVPPGYYAYLNFNNATSIFLNMPYLGVQFARRVWFFLLTDRSWSEASLTKVDSALACFKSSAGNDSSFVDHDTLALAAAVETVQKLLNDGEDWYMQKTAWSVWTISNSQFFYIRYAFGLCSHDGACASCPINLPLRQTKDFSLSFTCPVTSAMSEQRVCFF